MTQRQADAAVRVAAAPLTIADLLKVANGAHVELAREAVDRIRASREVVDQLVRGEALIYGLNTGLGHMRDQRVPLETLRDYQEGIVRTHAGGIGAPLPVPVVRAAMLVRLAGIARGGAGASLAVAETLTAMLNAGVHPVVPQVGSVGASDLMHMASIAMVAIGLGEAEFEGSTLPGAEAMQRAGIPRLTLEPKDGLAFVSANGVAIGHGALVVDRATRTAEVLDVVAALSLEAIRGNPSIVEPVVAAAKPIAGQVAAAKHLRELISGSRLCQPDGPLSVQDPLSFRVLPQVHGALRELVAFAREAVDGELASMDDNPLVVVAERRIVSNGNFHPMLMALAFDALRPGLAHAGQLSERRVGHLFDALVSQPEVFADGGLGMARQVGGAALVRYAAAARYTELKQLAAPASLDIPALDVGVEDHATNAPLTVRRTDEALDVLDDLLAAELLTAWASLRMASDVGGELGSGTSKIRSALDAQVARLGPSPSTQDMHSAACQLVRDWGSGVGQTTGS
jgi:histidine ammonia-lyase